MLPRRPFMLPSRPFMLPKRPVEPRRPVFQGLRSRVNSASEISPSPLASMDSNSRHVVVTCVCLSCHVNRTDQAPIMMRSRRRFMVPRALYLLLPSFLPPSFLPSLPTSLPPSLPLFPACPSLSLPLPPSLSLLPLLLTHHIPERPLELVEAEHTIAISVGLLEGRDCRLPRLVLLGERVRSLQSRALSPFVCVHEIAVCVVCVCVVCVCVCARARVCACVCVCASTVIK